MGSLVKKVEIICLIKLQELEYRNLSRRTGGHV